MNAQIQPETYNPIGSCIYCGATKSKLTKEHIIPFGLGGNLVLPKSSCLICSKVTAEVEQYCQRTMLGQFRIRMKFPTRRPSERPDLLPVEFIRSNGTKESTLVPVENAVASCIGFRFPAPGILRGVEPSEMLEGEMVVRTIVDNAKPYLQEGQKVKVGSTNALMFCRMLAKIAHSYAVAKSGLGTFRPLLRDMILGRSKTPLYLVGGDESGLPQGVQQLLHEIYTQKCLSNGKTYVLVAIQLFAVIGMPRYHVVVGVEDG